MIRLPKNFFINLNLEQYREQLKLLPHLNDESTRVYTMLGFTLLAMSFFGIFAINPTLSTIVELRRQFEDLRVVNQELITKGQNLSALQEKYQFLAPQLQVVFNAIPQKPEIPKFVAQVNALLKRSNLKTKSLRTFGIEITPDKKVIGKNPSSFVFTLEAEGSYDDILSFSQKITRINRLVTLEMISITKDEKTGTLMLNVRGREYFSP